MFQRTKSWIVIFFFFFNDTATTEIYTLSYTTLFRSKWHRPQFIRLVEKYRVCWVWADTTSLHERNLAPFEFLPCTTDFLYLRLLGDYVTKYDVNGAHIHRYGKLLWKREAALESWSLKI